MDVYASKKADNLPVLVFFYGGSWESGEKEIYHLLGNRLARRDLIVVISDYHLASEYKLPAMQKSALEAVNWTKDNLKNMAEIQIEYSFLGIQQAVIWLP